MNARQILMIIALIFMIPLFIQLISFSINIGTEDAQANTDATADLLVEAATPWWLGIVETLSSWGTFGAIIIIILFMLLSRNPDLA